MHIPIALRSKRFTAGVAPSLGGALVWFGLAEDPLIEFVRATPARVLHDGNARLASCYPLVPYSNRIGDGRFEFEGRPITLRRNTQISEHPIHGVGFQREWTVMSASDRELTIALDHDGRNGTDADWPWSFTATQSFVLDDDALTLRITLTNRDPRIMPAGIGFHPFFPKSSSTQLRFEAARVWKSDSRMLPIKLTEVPEAFDFRKSRALDTLDVDNCFDGWNRAAELEWPDRKWGLHIAASEAFRHLIVFTSPSRDAIAIEPVSHATNAVNLTRQRSDTGLVSLSSGGGIEGAMTLSPFALDG